METDGLKIVEEDAIVIFDASDDYDPGEQQIINDDDELDIDYLIKQTCIQEARKRKDQRRQLLVSVILIATVIAYIGIVCYMNFKDIIF